VRQYVFFPRAAIDFQHPAPSFDAEFIPNSVREGQNGITCLGNIWGIPLSIGLTAIFMRGRARLSRSMKLEHCRALTFVGVFHISTFLGWTKKGDHSGWISAPVPFRAVPYWGQSVGDDGKMDLLSELSAVRINFYSWG
jgi:hypothetical protein